MTHTFTFGECYAMLDVDAKTFGRWLVKAGIDPEHQVSRVDNRIRFLTEAQLQQLAADHGRTLKAPGTQKAPAEPITANAYKLVLDRLDTLERETRRLDTQAGYYGDRLDEHQEQQQAQIKKHGELADCLAATQAEIADLRQQLHDTRATQAEQAAQIAALGEQITALHQAKGRARQRAASAAQAPDIPGAIPARRFAEMHGLTRELITGQISRNEIAATLVPFRGKSQFQLSPEQQAAAVAYWQQISLDFAPCDQCPHSKATE